MLPPPSVKHPTPPWEPNNSQAQSKSGEGLAGETASGQPRMQAEKVEPQCKEEREGDEEGQGIVSLDKLYTTEIKCKPEMLFKIFQ